MRKYYDLQSHIQLFIKTVSARKLILEIASNSTWTTESLLFAPQFVKDERENDLSNTYRQATNKQNK